MAFGEAMLGAAAGNAAANAAAALEAIYRVEERLAKIENRLAKTYHAIDSVGYVLGMWARDGREGEEVSPREDAQLEKIIRLLEEARKAQGGS
jgi:hypothetical protein